jgi:hypothetical protein
MKSLSLSIAMILAGAVSGIAGTSVWSFDKPKGNEMQPARWGDVYAQPEADGATGKLATTTEGYQQFTTKLVFNGSQYSAAGFSLVWKQSATVDLSSYPGLCLTYKADRPFRVDFKQTSVTDYNYYGIVLDAQTDFVSKFIDFQSLAQEGGWGTEVPLDLTEQEAIQINYKEGIASILEESDTDRLNNVITVSAVSLGECETEPPVVEEFTVLEPYDQIQKITVKETETLDIDLKKVFAAKEGETITVTAMVPSVLKQVKPEGAISITDVISLAPTSIDKDVTASLIIYAESENKSEAVTFKITITNEEDGPDGPTCPGDPECPDDPPAENHPVTIKAPYNVEATIVNMKETDTLKVALDDLFEDEDNDKITFAFAMSDPLMKNLTSMDKITLKDTVFVIPTAIKKDTSLIIAFYATDGKDTSIATVQFIVNIEDVNLNRVPVATEIEYDAKEDTPLTVSMATSISKQVTDPDGDDFIVVPVDSTKHGKVTLFTQYGTFVYTPEKDFYGNDTLTYVLVETANHEMISAKAAVVIHVKPVNDAPTFVVADSAFLQDTLRLDMNFDEDKIPQLKVPVKSLVFSDVEVTEGLQKLSYGAKGTKIVADLDSVNATYYYISLKPVTDANGDASIFLFATDETDTAGVKIPVKLVSPKDVAHAEKDTYSTFNDTVLTVSAKEGVLANDVYPEGVTKGMEAELAQKPTSGTLVLNKDGSFKYTPAEGFEGVDYFGYYDVVNGVKSTAAIVTITVEKRNLLPTVTVKEGALDTTVAEDFPASRALKYPKSVVASWFKDPEGDSLAFSAKSKDGKLKVEITSAGTLEINSVEDSTGKAYVTVIATDKKSGSKSFDFCVKITPVNDKPKLLRSADTMYVAKSGWKVKWNLDTLVTDVDGDEITFTPNETSALTKYMNISLKGSVLTVTAIDGLKYKDGQKFALGVKASDPEKLNVTVPLYIIVGERPASLMPQLAQPKASWQNAVMAKCGSVSILDMQGRIVWSAKLPVNPSEVKNASAQIQGRKILRVNKQTWTIK